MDMVKKRDKMNNSIEKVKAYLIIKSFLNKKEQDDLDKILSLTDTDLSKRIRGQDNEIEFVLMVVI